MLFQNKRGGCVWMKSRTTFSVQLYTQHQLGGGLNPLTPSRYIERQWLKCKIRGGERYIEVWAPNNGRMPFPSIITILGGRTL